MRSVVRAIRKLWAGIVIGVLVPVLIGRITCGLIRLVWTRRRRRETFWRSLREAGLTPDEAELLTVQDNGRISLRELLQERHRFGH